MEDRLENFCHSFLKQRWGYFQTKQHDDPLIMGVWNYESSFVSIIWMNSRLPKTCFEIKFQEILSIVEI